MYRHILIPTDGSALSETTVRHGMALANERGAPGRRARDTGTVLDDEP